MKVFQKIQGMSETELAEFINAVYNKGWFDGANGVDDEVVFGACTLHYCTGFSNPLLRLNRLYPNWTRLSA